jgi:hypothetical protein
LFRTGSVGETELPRRDLTGAERLRCSSAPWLIAEAGQDVIADPWSDRPNRLEDIGTSLTVPNMTIVPVTDDAAQLLTTA